MQSFKSAVFTAFTALFLAASLSGCSDGEKASSLDNQQKAEAEHGKVFSLPSGTSLVYVDYSSEDVKHQLQSEMLRLFEEQGIRVNTRTSYGEAAGSALRLMEPLDEKKTLNVTMPGVKDIRAG